MGARAEAGRPREATARVQVTGAGEWNQCGSSGGGEKTGRWSQRKDQWLDVERERERPTGNMAPSL